MRIYTNDIGILCITGIFKQRVGEELRISCIEILPDYDLTIGNTSIIKKENIEIFNVELVGITEKNKAEELKEELEKLAKRKGYTEL